MKSWSGCTYISLAESWREVSSTQYLWQVGSQSPRLHVLSVNVPRGYVWCCVKAPGCEQALRLKRSCSLLPEEVLSFASSGYLGHALPCTEGTVEVGAWLRRLALEVKTLTPFALWGRSLDDATWILSQWEPILRLRLDLTAQAEVRDV